MIILGIETSCDETSAALLEIKQGKFKILAHVVSSSVKEHAKYGGIVPEVAARKQIEYIIPVLNETLKTRSSKIKAQNSKQDQSSKSKGLKNLELRTLGLEFVTAIAVTIGPGLATALQVGIDAAKSLAYTWQKPIIPVNHLEGHLYSPLLEIDKKIKFPAIGLIVSGGHTELILIKDYLKYELLGRTRDDAAGEAFDKVAKLLDLGYPGGPIIGKLAKAGNSGVYNFPRGMINSDDFDFSFSGLKTAVLYQVRDNPKMKSKKELPHVAASFEQAVVDVLVSKTMKAAKQYKVKTILLGGGVAANQLLRKTLEDKAQEINITYLPTPIAYSGDNASMISLAGYFRYKAKQFIKPNPQTKAWQKIKVQPNLKLV